MLTIAAAGAERLRLCCASQVLNVQKCSGAGRGLVNSPGLGRLSQAQAVLLKLLEMRVQGPHHLSAAPSTGISFQLNCTGM